MRDLLQEIIDYLIQQGVATEKDRDIFKDHTPDQPDTCLVVREYNGGAAPWYSEASQRSVQVVARAKNSQEAMQKAWAAFSALRPTDSIVNYLGHPCMIHIRNTPIKIDKDERGRNVYAFNMGVITN